MELVQLEGFLAHALVTNSLATNQTLHMDYVKPTTIWNISDVSISVFVSLTSGVFVICLAMLAISSRSVVPNTCLYPDVTFCGRGGNGDIRGLSNATSQTVIRKLLGVRVKVGEGVDREGRLRMLISSEDIPRLRGSVPYY